MLLGLLAFVAGARVIVRSPRPIWTAAVVAVGIAVGVAGTFATAFGLRIALLALIGQDGIEARDDTLLMNLLTAGCYLVGGIAGLLVLTFGGRRLLRDRRVG